MPGAERARRPRARARSERRSASPSSSGRRTTTSPRSSTRSRRTSAPDGRWFHYGLTSSDVLDTALALTVQDAGELIREGIDRAFDAVVARAEEHRDTVTIGRTHGVHAEPTTFGLKLAGLGVPARARPRPARPRARRDARREALGRGRHVCDDDARGRADRVRGARARAGAELDADPPARPPRGAPVRARARSRRRSIASRSRSDTSRARRCARSRSRSRAGQKGSSAMPHKRNPIVSERICGLARLVRGYALVGLENVALWHERDISHSSAERVVLPDAFLAVDYMLDRFAWLVEGLVVRPGADAREPRGDRRALLQPAAAARARRVGPRPRRRVPAGAAPRDARVGRGSRLPRARSRGCGDRGAASTSTRSSTSARTRGTSTSCSRACEPRSRARGGARVSVEATHVASGKVREIYALDDETLALVASDRISTFDVVLPTPIPDKGRVLTGLSAFWFARTREIVPNHLLELASDGRTMVCRKLEMLPIECVVRGYLAGSGWKDYRETGAVCGHELPAGLAGVGAAARADLHAGDEGDRGPRREHRRGARGRRSAARSATARREAGVARALPVRVGARGGARDHPRGHEVRARRRARRDGRARRRGADAGLVALLARVGVRAGSAAAVVRQAVRPRLVRADRVEQGRRLGPSFPTTSSPGRARATSRRSSGSRRSRSTSTSRDPEVVL